MGRFKSLFAEFDHYRPFKDLTKALHSCFAAQKPPLSLPLDTRRTLQHFVQDHEARVSREDSVRANQELCSFFDQHVGDNLDRRAVFVGVLRELRPVLLGDHEIWSWWRLVVRPVLCGTNYRDSVVDDAREFVVGCMTVEHSQPEPEDDHDQTKTLIRLRTELLEIYLTRTRPLDGDDHTLAKDNAQIAKQAEDTLFAFGRKQPKDLFHSIDDLILDANARLQALTLLTSFLRLQTPHLYLVVNTPLIEHLLKCLMNDQSTPVLSAALTSLIMLMPHIPGSLAQHLPRLFLIYSRLLCWEKFSPLSTEAQKNLVRDDRIVTGPDADEDYDDVGYDANWDRVVPKEGLVEAKTPELLTYFTYLYGLYPLNLMSYVRKPRRYLRDVDFPGAEDFDLDRSVIRSRTDQFRQAHLLHPNFYTMTLEEELSDPKWPKADPSDVVAECQGLCIHYKAALVSVGSAPTKKLPEPPAVSVISDRGGSPVSWRDTESTVIAGDSPTIRPQNYGVSSDDEGASPALKQLPRNAASATSLPPAALQSPSAKAGKDEPSDNMSYLQRENILLRNNLNFERWHKAQYQQHIGQLMRKNVRDSTAEAETLNLINANRALKKQIEQLRTARESSVKDSTLTRKRADKLELTMQERIGKLKKEEEGWQADSDELKRLRSETKQYRDRLAASEAREKNVANQISTIQRELHEKDQLHDKLRDMQRVLREYEYREFEFDRAQKDLRALEQERKALQIALERHEEDRARSRHLYMERLTDMETRMADGRGQHFDAGETNSELQAKFNALKKTHHRLLDKYTDLEIELQSLRSQLESSPDVPLSEHGLHSRAVQSLRPTHADGHYPPPLSPIGSEDGYPRSNFSYPRSYPTSARDGWAEDASLRQQQNQSFRPKTAAASTGEQGQLQQVVSEPASRRSSIPSRFNQTAPLRSDEGSAAASEGSGTVDGGRESPTLKKKIEPQSEVRVYGRGGRQNIKMTEKAAPPKASSNGKGSEGPATEGSPAEKKKGGSGSFRGFRNIL